MTSLVSPLVTQAVMVIAQKRSNTMNKVNMVANLYATGTHGGFAGSIYDPFGISPCLTGYGGGNREPFIIYGCEVQES